MITFYVLSNSSFFMGGWIYGGLDAAMLVMANGAGEMGKFTTPLARPFDYSIRGNICKTVYV